MVRWLYARYGGEYIDDEDSLAEAIELAQASSEFGEAYTIALYDPLENKLFVPDLEPIGIKSPEWRLDKTRKMLRLAQDHQFLSVECYPAFPED